MSKKKKKDDPQVEAATEEELEQLEAGPEEWKDKYLRTLADIDNMRKRGEKERASARKYALEAFMRDFLPVLDSLEFAAAAEGDADAIRQGLDIALADALRVMQSHGLETIEAHGETFDPRFHEAIGMRPHDELEPGKVAEEERKGYMLNERVLRPSRVHIVIAPQQPADKEE